MLALLRARAHRQGPMGAHLAARSADLHARLPGGALADRRARCRQQAGNDHPTGIPDRRVPDLRRPHQHRGLRRQPVGALLQGARRAGADRPPGLRDRRRALRRTARCSTASSPSGPRPTPSAHWIAALNKAGVPCGPINNDRPDVRRAAGQAPRHRAQGAPQEARRDARRRPADQHVAAIPQPETLGATPDLGEHTADVLTSISATATPTSRRSRPRA